MIVLTLQGYGVCQKEFHDLSSQILSDRESGKTPAVSNVSSHEANAGGSIYGLAAGGRTHHKEVEATVTTGQIYGRRYNTPALVPNAPGAIHWFD